MCKLLGAEKDPDSVLVMTNFKEIISFFLYNVKVPIWTERHANRRTYRSTQVARRKICFLATLKE